VGEAENSHLGNEKCVQNLSQIIRSGSGLENREYGRGDPLR
jgi:hypothetical protein